MSMSKEKFGLLGRKEQSIDGSQQPTSNEARRSSKGSDNQTCPLSQTVKEAVAIAAGKKESGGDDDDGKNIKSNMLCYLYWLLVVLILGLISFTIWLSIQLARRHNEMNEIGFRNSDHRKRFDFEDIFNTSFQPRTFEAEWVKGSDSLVYRSNDDESLYLFNVTSNATTKIIDSSVFNEYKTMDYRISHDLRYILLKVDPQKLWKHSSSAKYIVYDRLVKSAVSQVYHLGADGVEEREGNSRLQYAEMAPSSDAIAFVHANNLYVQRSLKSRPSKLTTSGSVENHIYNGIADWTYETLLHKTQVMWWSPDSKHIVYLSLNDSEVEKFHFVKGYSGTKDEVISVPYPRAYPSGKIPKVEVRVLSVDDPVDENLHKVLTAPDELINKDCYVSQVIWKNSHNVTVVWLNRAQNQSYTTLYSIKNPVPNNLHYQISTTGWIEILPQLVFTHHKDSYLTILPMKQHDSSYWNHLALISPKPWKMRETEVEFLTEGLQDVVFISSYDKKSQDVYYIATNEDPKKRHLFKLNIPSRRSNCITCEESQSCQWVEVSFSQSRNFFMQSCLGPSIPYYVLRTANNSYTKLLEENKILKAAVENKILPERKFYEVPVGDEKKAWVEIIQPQEEGSKKFPLLIQASGEPGSQTVTFKYRLGWETYMASSEEVAVARVDVAGSGGKGVTYKHRVYKQMTFSDVNDLQLVGLYLKESDLVDPAKVAVWGWGHSGLMALHALANESDIFPCGLVGGVTAGVEFYDAPTFERYFGLSEPEDNQDGYVRSSILNKVGLLKVKRLALVQGLADDHVKHASTMTLLDSLSDLDILHTYRTYSDIGASGSSKHRNLLHLTSKFFNQDCFTFFWKHDTKSWVVDKAAQKEKFRIKQFCV